MLKQVVQIVTTKAENSYWSASMEIDGLYTIFLWINCWEHSVGSQY
jgi:hypothetical protein